MTNDETEPARPRPSRFGLRHSFVIGGAFDIRHSLPRSLYMSTTSQVDVVVVGGGPSGTTVATLLAKKGYAVELFEREHFPRFHIGESMIPNTYFALERTGMLEKMKGSQF